jgi:dihydroorotase-like cyclic amidohydrolase
MSWYQTAESIVSKSVNTPYLDTPLTGKVRHVSYRGRLTVENGELA